VADAGEDRYATLRLDSQCLITYFVSTVSLSTGLGEFETLVLLAVLHLTERQQEAYGSAIRDEY
jgi:hypothetical protein